MSRPTFEQRAARTALAIMEKILKGEEVSESQQQAALTVLNYLETVQNAGEKRKVRRERKRNRIIKEQRLELEGKRKEAEAKGNSEARDALKELYG
jgi:hypothetical protein